MTVLPDSENGYLLNYEDQEQRRMNLQHDLIKTYLDKLILAPLPFDKPNLRWNPRPGKLVRQRLEQYGLEDVQEKVMEIPIGAGNSDPRLGKMAKQNMLEVVANFRTAATRLTDGTGIHAENFDLILRDINLEFETVGGILQFNTVLGSSAIDGYSQDVE